MAAAGGLEEFVRTLKDKRRLAMLAASGVLIAINWTLYVVAVVNDHVLETSLGYFINPLLNVVLAVVVLREHLPVAGRIAVALAAVGVGRSEERRVGKGWGSTCRFRLSPYHKKKKKKQ